MVRICAPDDERKDGEEGREGKDGGRREAEEEEEGNSHGGRSTKTMEDGSSPPFDEQRRLFSTKWENSWENGECGREGQKDWSGSARSRSSSSSSSEEEGRSPIRVVEQRVSALIHSSILLLIILVRPIIALSLCLFCDYFGVLLICWDC